MNTSSFAQGLAVSGMMPRLSVGMSRAINIGLLAPQTGNVQSWGLPGLNGCRIWEDSLNRAGGLLLGGQRFPVKIFAADCRYDPATARKEALKLIHDHDVQLLMTLGGDSLSLIKDDLMDRKILTTTLLPSDLSPDTPFLLAPSELHPLYTVTGVEWLAQNRPDLKTIALCGQQDALGLPSLAAYRAACKAAGIEIVKDIQYDPGSPNIAEIGDAMMASGADVLCWCTSYTPAVHALSEHVFHASFKGQILSCTLDNYAQLVARTSADFLEGTVFQFPDFDDPALSDMDFFFRRPSDFFETYNQRFPGTWTAVSWEFAAILDIWHAAVEKAGSTHSVSVLAAMKQMGHVAHAFGPAKWWGGDVYGIDNALVGNWPVVTIRGGKAKIEEFGSIPNWLAKNSALLRREMRDLGQMWDQRLESDLSAPHLGKGP